MASSTDSTHRPRQRRRVPRNLLTYDERRKLKAPAAASPECARRGCEKPAAPGSVCCSQHSEGLARLKADLDQPWDWKDGKQGYRPRRSDQQGHSANWIARLHRLEGKGPSTARELPRVRRPTDDLDRTSEDVLTCLPGISTVGAQRLFAHFGSLSAVFSATETELRRVAGIGPIRATALARLFTGRH